MTRISLTEAQLRLPELIESLQPGEEVQIFSGDRTVARLICELQPPRKPRQPGSAIGTLTIVSEDETHLEEDVFLSLKQLLAETLRQLHKLLATY